MKLSATQVEQVEDQSGAMPIPDDNPGLAGLTKTFGEHTFYVDPDGLHVFEWDQEQAGEDGASTVKLVQLAEWTDDNRTHLKQMKPIEAPSGIRLLR